MMNKTQTLKIGDKIGFVSLAADLDSNDTVVFFPVIEITERDGETAYRYQYPDGQISRRAIKQSELKHYTIKIERSEIIAPQIEDAICLTDRRLEFQAASKRANENILEVYRGWDNDTYHIVNRTNDTEYMVELKMVDGKLHSQCDCRDFYYRKRVCKHIAEALQVTLFGAGQAV